LPSVSIISSSSSSFGFSLPSIIMPVIHPIW
jgi:hypothetical protein